MNETEFLEALAEFTTKSADQLEFSDGLREIGVDSIGVFEFVMKIEDVVADVQVPEAAETVQDLYDSVLDAAEQAV